MDRAQSLANRLGAAADALVAVVTSVDGDRWSRVPAPGVWSVGKEAEHVGEAAVYHQWIVRLTIGEKVGSRRPPIERAALITSLSPADAVARILERTDEGVRLLLGLTDAHLDLPTRPPRAQDERLATTIQRVLIGHYDVHRASIEAQLGDG